jgi:cbb3-type cytochrome oxidase maturation protein
MAFEYLTLAELLVALLMGLAALCAFVWGATSGALSDVEDAKHQVLRAEAAEEAGPPSPGSPSLNG